MNPSRRRFVYAFGLVVCVGSVLALAGIANARGWSLWTTIPAMVLSGLAAVFLLLHFRSAFVRTARSGKAPAEDGADLSAADLLLRASRTKDDRSSAQLIAFEQAIIKPATIRGRLVEEIKPAKRTLRQRVTSAITIPAPVNNKDDHFYIPVMTVPKRDLQDDLHVTLADGTPLTVLNYTEYLVLVTNLLHMLFILALIDDSVANRVPSLEENAIELIKQRGKQLHDPAGCVREISDLQRYAEHPSYLLAAAKLVSTLASNYPIVAIVPRPDNKQMRTIIEYERFIIPRLRCVPFSESPLRYLKDHLGRLVGARPIELDLDLGNAAVAQSYHIHVCGPDGTYLGFQEMLGVDAALSGEKRAYYRLRRRLGQAYAHVYMRFIPLEAGAKLRLHLRFYEVPPGSIAKASIGAFANLLLMFSAAVLLAAKPSALASDFPVLVLTIPAVVSAWVGLDAPGRHLLDGTLASRLSCMFTLGASLASSALYMAQVSGARRFPQDHFNFFGVKDTAWQILVLGALINFVWTTYLWIGRSVTFYSLADRDIHRGGQPHAPAES